VKLNLVTFKDLKKRVSLEVTTQQRSRLSEILKDKPFWIWNIEKHKQEDIITNGDCCFNHIIGLPQKDGTDKPLYDYEKIIFDSLVTHHGNTPKHLWIKKATGLGISEFMLRFMAWLCLKDNSLSGSQMCIVTGPRIDLAIALIDRMKKLFASNKGIAAAFDTKGTAAYVLEHLGISINKDYVRHIRMQIKQDSAKELALLTKDRDCYLQRTFWDRLAKLYRSMDQV
jgi:hypothetical protein